MFETYSDIDVRQLAPSICKLLAVPYPDECEVEPIPDLIKDLSHRIRLALIIINSVGVFTLNSHENCSPFISSFKHDNYIPIRSLFPNTTPNNLASITTGVSPVKHSIRNKNETIIHDTIFDALKRGNRSTSICAREQSSLNMMFSDKADNTIISKQNNDEEIIHFCEDIIENHDPDFCMVQLLEMDDIQHKFGVANPTTGNALKRFDDRLKDLCDIFHEFEYGIIICADHGHHDLDNNMGGTHDGTSKEDIAVPLVWIV